jgi:hypothetical protein
MDDFKGNDSGKVPKCRSDRRVLAGCCSAPEWVFQHVSDVKPGVEGELIQMTYFLPGGGIV